MSFALSLCSHPASISCASSATSALPNGIWPARCAALSLASSSFPRSTRNSKGRFREKWASSLRSANPNSSQPVSGLETSISSNSCTETLTSLSRIRGWIEVEQKVWRTDGAPSLQSMATQLSRRATSSQSLTIYTQPILNQYSRLKSHLLSWQSWLGDGLKFVSRSYFSRLPA